MVQILSAVYYTLQRDKSDARCLLPKTQWIVEKLSPCLDSEQVHIFSSVSQIDWLPPAKKVQLVFLGCFVLINVALLLLAAMEEVETPDGQKFLLHPAYAQASDGQRYWGTAVSVAQTGQFAMRSELDIYSFGQPLQPLSRAGPIPAILFALPIKMFGIDAAVFFIIAGQCLMLWIMGLAARGIAAPFGANKDLAQALVLFNPNLIGVAHHAQSDLIFAVILTLLLLGISILIEKPSRIRFRSAAGVAILAGLLPLARPVGTYCVILLPFFIVAALLIRQRFVHVDWKNLFRLGTIGALITLVIVAPWAIRNYVVFSDLGLSQSGAIQARYYYRALRPYGMPDSTPAIEAYLAKHDHDPSCIDSGGPGSGCEKAIRNAYMDLILSTPKTILFKALSSATLKTLLAGGTRTITDYVGLKPPGQQQSLSEALDWESLQNFIVSANRSNPTYLLLFLAITAFPIFTRGLGLIGVVRALRNPHCHAHLAFHILIIALLLALYGLHGWSRFRVPLEPILMVFTAISLSKLKTGSPP